MRARNNSAFTLTELLVVIVILAILAAIVVPKVADSNREAEVAAAKASLRAIEAKIDEHYRIHGVWPTNLDVGWFVGHRLPKSPWKAPHNGEAANIFGQAHWHHPNTKISENHNHPYWYNNLSGAIRIRVPRQDNNEATLAFYNRVNDTNARSLSQNGM